MSRAKRPTRGTGAGVSRAEGSHDAAAGPVPAAASWLLGGLVALQLLRTIAAYAPGRWLWGLDLGRDLPPGWFAAGTIVTLFACVPAVWKRAAAAWPAGGTRVVAIAGALALALFAWSFPDRALYTGDASIRHGAFAQVTNPEVLAEQALRGDLVLHHAFPRWVSEHTGWTSDEAGRALGALLAALTVLAGAALARARRAGGLLGFGVVAIAACTAALALDNGYGKATVEIAALTSVFAVGIVRVASDRAPGKAGAGFVTVGATLALALLLHRSALALVPAWLVAAMVVLRAGRAREPGTIVGLAAPVAALALVGPRLWQVVSTFDRSHHAAGGVAATLVTALTPLRLLDSVNALVLLVPLAPLAPWLLALEPRPSARAWALAAALVLPPLALLLVLQPQHELPRDWDVFAFAGSAFAALLAWRVADVLGARPAARGLALPLALASAIPALQWVALQSRPENLWTRAEAILAGPPPRRASEIADGLGTLGIMRLGRGQPQHALELFERSAEHAPNPRMFVQIGMAETMLGHPDRAMARYRHAASLNPDLNAAWRGVAAAASTLGDRASMREAVANLERLEPDGETLRDARAWLEANPAH